jgi:hypothetical protein
MTTTDNRPTVTQDEGPVRIDPVADLPAHCPPWCGGHDPQYAEDFGGFASREDMADALTDWREPKRDIADVTLWTLTHGVIEGYQPNWVERPETSYYALTLLAADGEYGPTSLTPVNLSLRFSTSVQMTGAEARQMAAYLVRAADLLDRDENDR